MKAAFVALENCALWQVAMLQKLLYNDGWVWRTITLDGQSVRSDGGIRLAADSAVELASPRDYQLVLFAGGDVTEREAENPALQRFLRQFDGRGGWIAASCASAVILGATGLLGGRRFTALSHTVDAFPDYFSKSIFVNEDVSIDGNIITAKGHAHLEFATAVAESIGLNQRDPKALPMARKLIRNEV